MSTFSEIQLQHIKQKALQAAAAYDVAMILDNNFCQNAFGIRHIEFAVALGVKHELVCNAHSFEQLHKFVQQHHHQYVFTTLSYDLKNELEALQSNNPNHINFNACYAFVPQHVLVIDADGKCIVGQEWAEELLSQHLNDSATIHLNEPIDIHQKVSQQQYIHDVQTIRKHIEEGDVYELNYCMEFFANHAHINPIQVYQKLIQKSPVPFAAFVKQHHNYLLCASPERFITRKGSHVYSQPIKGTSPRSKDEVQDEAYKQALLNSEKERAENLMIVDLVRNDLAKTAQTGTVEVNELFGIYKFPQVHQMISTVSAQPLPEVNNIEVIKQAFPMGSMTGAPKIMTMTLIEQYEQTKRGLYSGAVGYFAPNGDFDFNVVIRSLQYNSQNQYLSYEVGSAITYDSVPEEEYEECLLKAKAMMEVLKGI